MSPSHLMLVPYVHTRGLLSVLRRRMAADERGEGVVSAALAVLIMAFLAALMWVVFKQMFTSTTAKTKDQVDLIGS